MKSQKTIKENSSKVLKKAKNALRNPKIIFPFFYYKTRTIIAYCLKYKIKSAIAYRLKHVCFSRGYSDNSTSFKKIQRVKNFIYSLPNTVATEIKLARVKATRATNYFFRIEPILDGLCNALKSEGISGATLYLKKRYRFFFKPAHAKFLSALYDFLPKFKASFIIPSNSKKSFIIHLCCWGKSYTSKAADYLFPSLLADGNLLAVSKKYHITILVHCDLTTKKKLEACQATKSIRKYADLILIALPKNIMKLYYRSFNYPNLPIFRAINQCNSVIKYFLLGALQTCALNESIKSKSLISFLVPDTVLSESFFSCAINQIEGKKLVLTSTFRTNFTKVSYELEKFRQPDNNSLKIPGEDLAKLQIKYLHPYDKRRIISEKTKYFLPCARFIFKTENGLTLRALHYHPMLLDCQKVSPNLQGDYLPIDDSIMKKILHDETSYEKDAWLCNDTSIMNVMELSEEEVMLSDPPLIGSLSTQYNTLVDTLCSMLTSGAEGLDRGMNKFFIQNKLRFVLDEPCFTKDAVINDELFIHDLYAKLSKQKKKQMENAIL